MLNISCAGTLEQKFKVGFLSDNFTVPRWVTEKDFFVEKANELGMEVLVRSANGNPDIQIDMANDLITEGVKLIVIIASNVNSAAAIVRNAHKKGVKVIAYDRLIRNSDLDFYLSFDNKKVGQLMTDYIVNIVPKGNYVIINGDVLDNNAHLVYNGIKDVLKNKSNINILYAGYMTGWSGQEAAYYMKKVIEFSGEDVDAVISAYDGMSYSVIKVLDEFYPDKNIPVTGQDGELQACINILNGKQTLTIYKSGKKMAYEAAEIAYKLVAGEHIEVDDYVFNGRIDVPAVLLEPVLIDKNNIEDVIIKEGVYTREQLGLN